ncbi:MAG: hypothetical protein LBT37_06325 [Lactobacillaceae bacterium]|jgi:hypothetical protein|nr:hypothetical protein [Lactobacillaceae bacterium]
MNLLSALIGGIPLLGIVEGLIANNVQKKHEALKRDARLDQMFEMLNTLKG